MQHFKPFDMWHTSSSEEILWCCEWTYLFVKLWWPWSKESMTLVWQLSSFSQDLDGLPYQANCHPNITLCIDQGLQRSQRASPFTTSLYNFFWEVSHVENSRLVEFSFGAESLFKLLWWLYPARRKLHLKHDRITESSVWAILFATEIQAYNLNYISSVNLYPTSKWKWCQFQ